MRIRPPFLISHSKEAETSSAIMAHAEDDRTFFERERDRLTAEITAVSRVQSDLEHALSPPRTGF